MTQHFRAASLQINDFTFCEFNTTVRFSKFDILFLLFMKKKEKFAPKAYLAKRITHQFSLLLYLRVETKLNYYVTKSF